MECLGDVSWEYKPGALGSSGTAGTIGGVLAGKLTILIIIRNIWTGQPLTIQGPVCKI